MLLHEFSEQVKSRGGELVGWDLDIWRPDVYEAYTAMAKKLRHLRAARRAYPAIRRTVDTSLFEDDPVAFAFARFLNATKRPVRPPQRDLAFKTGNIRGIQACPEVEQKIASLIRDLQANKQPGCQIFIDRHGEPVVLRKGGMYGFNSGLLLKEVVADGLPLPRFSIVALDVKTDPAWTKKSWHHIPDAPEVCSVGDINAMAFMRLASYCINQATQPALASEYYGRTELNTGKVTADVILETTRNIVQQNTE